MSYLDEELQDDVICHRGMCHEYKATCETCALHFETVSAMFEKHKNQYCSAVRARVIQVFRVDNPSTRANFVQKKQQFAQLPRGENIRCVKDLSVVARNYFREWFFRNSHDGNTISQRLLEELLVEKIFGPNNAPPHLNFSDKSKKLTWNGIWSIVKKDVENNSRKMAGFLSKCENQGAKVRWAWHGTKADAVKNIAAQNFQPSFKRRQVHGDGFYFSPDPRVAQTFAPSATGDDGKAYKVLLLSQVLLGHTASSRKGYGNSNTYRDYCYAIPDPQQINSRYVVVIGGRH